MKYLLFLLFFLGCFFSSLSAQDMHRKWGASIQGGLGVKTANYNGRNTRVGTIIKPGAIVGLNLRLRLSPKSSLQFSGSLIIDRYTILNHVEYRSRYGPGWPDTTYWKLEYGDVELETTSWQGVLAYRHTFNHQWGISLGFRLEGLLKESGNFTVKNIEHYRRAEDEAALTRSFEFVRPDSYYWIRAIDVDSGLQANVYCQLNRRLQLMASFDTPLPFVNYYEYSFTRYKLVLAHRLF